MIVYLAYCFVPDNHINSFLHVSEDWILKCKMSNLIRIMKKFQKTFYIFARQGPIILYYVPKHKSNSPDKRPKKCLSNFKWQDERR